MRTIILLHVVDSTHSTDSTLHDVYTHYTTLSLLFLLPGTPLVYPDSPGDGVFDAKKALLLCNQTALSVSLSAF